jgi:hypothetical protein
MDHSGQSPNYRFAFSERLSVVDRLFVAAVVGVVVVDSAAGPMVLAAVASRSLPAALSIADEPILPTAYTSHNHTHYEYCLH